MSTLQLTSHMSDLQIHLTTTGLAPGHLELLNVIVLVRHRLVANVHFAPPAYVVGIIAHSPSSAQREIARDRKWQHLLATRASSMPWQSPSTSAA